MKLLQRLYIKDFVLLLCILTLGLSVIFSLLDLTGKIDDFVRGKYSAGSLVLYSFYNMPRFFLYLLPMSVLVSSLFTFSQAARRNEIIAIKAAGGKLQRLYFPFVMTGAVLCVLAFVTSEVVVPVFSKKAGELRSSLEGKTKKLAFSDGGLWLKAKDGSPVKIDLYIADRKIAKGVGIFVLGNSFMKERLQAEKASWDGSKWILENTTIYDIGTGAIRKVATMDYTDLESPDLFEGEIKKPDDMNIFELFNYMQRLRNAGFRNMKLAVDINSRISFPLISVTMMLLGLSLSSTGRSRSGLVSAGMGLLISLVYWFGYTFSLSMGYSGVLPPLLAAWLVPFLFSAFAVRLFLKIPE